MSTSTRTPSPTGIALTELLPGSTGRLLAEGLEDGDRMLLEALGCPQRSRFRLCKAGAPWILQVDSTRIGLSDEVARRLRVLPETA